MFVIVCVTCSYRISEGFKTALSGDLQYIIAVQRVIVLNQCQVNLNMSNTNSN